MVKTDTHNCQFKSAHGVPKTKPNPGLWVLLKQLIRRLTTISCSHPQTRKLFRSTHATLREKLRHTESPEWFSIHPYSMFSYSWQIVMTFVYVANVAFDLGETTFLVQPGYKWSDCFMKYMVVLNVLSTIDIGLNFITGYVGNVETKEDDLLLNYTWAQAIVQLKKDKIALHYVKTFFFIDSITIMNTIVLIMSSYVEPSTAYYLLGVRMLRHARFKTVLDNVRKLMCKDALNAFLFFCIGFMYFYSKFVLTCLHILVPDMFVYFEGAPTRGYQNFLERKYDAVGRSLSTGAIYVHTTFLATFTLIGSYLNVNQTLDMPAKMIIGFSRTLGFFFILFFFAMVLHLLSNTYRSHFKFLVFMKSVSQYSMLRDSDGDTSGMLYRYMQDTLKTEMFDDKKILSTLQRKLVYEVFKESSMGILMTCQLFANLPSVVVGSIADRLKLETYPRGVHIMHAGTVATCMYFIRSGTVAVFDAHGDEVYHLSDGDFFGETGMIRYITSIRICDVFSIEYCELYRLDLGDFQEIIKPGSEFHQRIEETTVKLIINRRRSAIRPSFSPRKSIFQRNTF